MFCALNRVLMYIFSIDKRNLVLVLRIIWLRYTLTDMYWNHYNQNTWDGEFYIHMYIFIYSWDIYMDILWTGHVFNKSRIWLKRKLHPKEAVKKKTGVSQSSTGRRPNSNNLKRHCDEPNDLLTTKTLFKTPRIRHGVPSSVKEVACEVINMDVWISC